MKPWNWATIPLKSEPVEIVSYPVPNSCPVCSGRGDVATIGALREACLECRGTGKAETTIMVRLKVGDPTSIKEIPLRAVAAFAPNRHEYIHRARVYYSDNPTAFIFKDELDAARSAALDDRSLAERMLRTLEAINNFWGEAEPHSSSFPLSPDAQLFDHETSIREVVRHLLKEVTDGGGTL